MEFTNFIIKKTDNEEFVLTITYINKELKENMVSYRINKDYSKSKAANFSSKQDASERKKIREIIKELFGGFEEIKKYYETETTNLLNDNLQNYTSELINENYSKYTILIKNKKEEEKYKFIIDKENRLADKFEKIKIYNQVNNYPVSILVINYNTEKKLYKLLKEKAKTASCIRIKMLFHK